MRVHEAIAGSWREQWAPFEDAVYLNTAAQGAMPQVSHDAVQTALTAKRYPHRSSDAVYFDATNRLRQSLAQLIGARADEIAINTGASAGLLNVVHGLEWRAGDEVITAAGEFPMQYATWKPLEGREGVRLKIVTPAGRFITADDVIAAITPKTRVVSVSHVRFDDASLLDAARVGEFCRRHDVLFVLDITQSCGALPLDVHALGADVVVCAGYKWLLSPYGTGFMWARRERLDEWRPMPFYWTGQDIGSFSELNMVNPTPTRDARRLDAAETASYFNLNVTAFDESVHFVCQVGPEAVRTHNQELIEMLFAALPSGCVPASPLDVQQRGPYGCFVAESRERTTALHRTLREHGVFVSLREGRIRVSPHLFNSGHDIESLVRVVREWTRT